MSFDSRFHCLKGIRNYYGGCKWSSTKFCFSDEKFVATKKHKIAIFLIRKKERKKKKKTLTKRKCIISYGHFMCCLQTQQVLTFFLYLKNCCRQLFLFYLGECLHTKCTLWISSIVLNSWDITTPSFINISEVSTTIDLNYSSRYFTKVFVATHSVRKHLQTSTFLVCCNISKTIICCRGKKNS